MHQISGAWLYCRAIGPSVNNYLIGTNPYAGNLDLLPGQVTQATLQRPERYIRAFSFFVNQISIQPLHPLLPARAVLVRYKRPRPG